MEKSTTIAFLTGGMCVSSDCRKPRNLSVCKEGDQAFSTDSPANNNGYFLLLLLSRFLFSQCLCPGLLADRCAEITPSNWCQRLWDSVVHCSLVLCRLVFMQCGFVVMMIMTSEWQICCLTENCTKACKVMRSQQAKQKCAFFPLADFCSLLLLLLLTFVSAGND